MALVDGYNVIMSDDDLRRLLDYASMEVGAGTAGKCGNREQTLQGITICSCLHAKRELVCLGGEERVVDRVGSWDRVLFKGETGALQMY